MKKFGIAWKGLLAAAAISIVGAVTATGAQAEEKLVLMTWGGDWLKYMQKDVIAPFEKETGIKVEASPSLRRRRITSTSTCGRRARCRRFWRPRKG
jgi:spermidine/putrescine-binding protein